MARIRTEFSDGDLHLANLGLWLDPHRRQTGPERVFVSHAHSDHTGRHREVILSAPTASLMQARLPGIRQEHVLPFGEKHRFQYLDQAFDLTLLPAGHILGSAMASIAFGGQTLLYTGDFKLRPSLSAERCEPVPADILIMETTFGRPHYVFPPNNDILRDIVRFCEETIANRQTPVLLGYSLGKSQELLCALRDAGFPLVLHKTIARFTRIYEMFGHTFPRHELYEGTSARGKVLLCPPNAGTPAMLRDVAPTRTAVLTGWAMDSGCRYAYRCDAAFPLSDHADFSELLEMVERVRPRKIYTLHGFAAEFARHLRHLGYDAQALGQDEQLDLPLAPAVSPQRPTAGNA